MIVELSDSSVTDDRSRSPITHVRAAPLTDVIAIHFPDQKALREHRARAYKNVHPHDDLLRVSPELFRPEDRSEVSIDSPHPGQRRPIGRPLTAFEEPSAR